MISQLWPGQYPSENPFTLSGQQTLVKRKHYNVIMGLKMVLELLPDSFGSSSVLIAQLDLDNLIDL
jgi:hypothetical protein